MNLYRLLLYHYNSIKWSENKISIVKAKTEILQEIPKRKCSPKIKGSLINVLSLKIRSKAWLSIKRKKGKFRRRIRRNWISCKRDSS